MIINMEKWRISGIRVWSSLLTLYKIKSGRKMLLGHWPLSGNLIMLCETVRISPFPIILGAAPWHLALLSMLPGWASKVSSFSAFGHLVHWTFSSWSKSFWCSPEPFSEPLQVSLMERSYKKRTKCWWHRWNHRVYKKWGYVIGPRLKKRTK